jgi:hypothetical protein
MGSVTRDFANSIGPGKTVSTGINFKNIIINGDMSIAQRATSVTGVNSGGYYTCDRWRFGGNLGAFTMSQETDVPTGQGFSNSVKLECTTAENTSTAVDTITLFSQRVEGQNLQYLKKGTSSAESTTASFWVKSNKTGTYILEMYDTDNSRTISKSYTIDSASTWEKKTLTFAGDTTGAFGNDNGGSLRFNFWLGAGTFYSSGTLATSWQTYDNTDRAVGQINLADTVGNELYITGIQLEAGTTASDFEFLPYDVNLRRCQRYYETFNMGATGVAYATDSIDFPIRFQTPKRANPSGTLIDTSIKTDRAAVGSYTSSGSVIQGALYSTTGAAVRLNGWTGLTNTLAMYTPYQTEDWIAFSSEL